MMSRKFLIFLLNAVLIENIFCQLQIPIGTGCGCQQIPIASGCGCQLPVQQNFQIANNCGCRNSLLGNLPNGIQIANSLLAQSLPCGCVPNNLQLGNLQGLQLSNLQLANGLQCGQCGNVPLSQDLLALVNAMPMSNCQNMLQFSMQALLSQLSQQPCQCGCQSVPANIGNSLINANLNLLGVNGVPKAINNCPCQQCANLQMLNGVPCAAQQEIVINNTPCPCQACQNVVSSQSCQNVVSNPCPCQSNPCSCQNPVQFTIYQ